MKSTTSLLIATAMFATYFVGMAEAFWRLPCKGIAGVGRLDPIVQPGVPSDHTHAIFGGSGFGFNSGADELLASNCTSCAVTQDRSAYWTPALYFVDSSGKTVLVPNVGGMLAYYDLFGENVEAFPNGFKMVAGDTRLRSSKLKFPDPPTSEWTDEDRSQPVLAQRALGFNCLHYQIDPPEPSRYRHFMPDKAFLDASCTSGLRLELMFPSCWNGKDLDSPNHKSHVAYPSLVDGGSCPKGFEKRTPTLFYETIWDTYAFKDKQGQFVLANGDPTGYGYHGDFLAAWEDGVLPEAVKKCTNLSGKVEDCPVFKLQSEADQSTCQFNMPPELKADNCHGPREGLPGNVLIQSGSGYAAKDSGNSAAMDSTTSQSSSMAAASVSSVPSSSSASSLSMPSAVAVSSQGGGYGVNYGGNFAEVVSSSSSSSVPSSSTSPPPAVAPAPETTPPPSAPAADVLNTVSTTYLTKGRQVYEIVVVDEQVTVTATSTLAAGKHKRHLHRHQHHRHGLV